jgi:hypothetical protein
MGLKFLGNKSTFREVMDNKHKSEKGKKYFTRTLSFRGLGKSRALSRVSPKFRDRYSFRLEHRLTSLGIPHLPRILNMAGFFDLKARKEAAATNGASSKAAPVKETNRLQPWVEK